MQEMEIQNTINAKIIMILSFGKHKELENATTQVKVSAKSKHRIGTLKKSNTDKRPIRFGFQGHET